MVSRAWRSVPAILCVPVMLAAVIGIGKSRSRDAAHALGIEIWRKSLLIGEDTPMRANMLMTQRRHGKTVTTSANIVQGPRGKYRMEYLLPEDAKGRIVFSDGRANWQYEPLKSLLATTALSPISEQRDRDSEVIIERNYDITLASDSQTACGRPAFLLRLTPRHIGKSTQLRWIDKKTFKTLRVETHYTDGILARMVSYNSVTLPAVVQDSEFVPARGAKLRTVSTGQSFLYVTTHTIPPTYANLKLSPQAALGFQLVEIGDSEIDRAHATQLLYSDGIETVSVFVQNGAAPFPAVPSNWTRVPIGTQTAFQNIDGHLDALTWISNGCRYTAVSHLVPEALKLFVQSQMQHQPNLP